MLSPQFSLVRVTAPAALPISVAEAKAQMRVEGSDDDTIIERLVNAAVAFVDVQGVLGRAMITQTWGEWLAPNPAPHGGWAGAGLCGARRCGVHPVFLN
jgi:uncharacterized phiE125 gp8 family phage protein